MDYGQVGGAQGYELDASSTQFIGGDVLFSSTVNGVLGSLTVAGLTPNTTYWLQVGSLWNGATSYDATQPSTSTLTSLIQNPEIYQSNISSITLNWTALSAPPTPPGIGYLLQASTASDFSGLIYFSSNTDVMFSTLTVTGLTTATNYYLRVGGLNWNDVPNFVPAGNTTTGSGPGPVNPTITDVSVSSLTAVWGSANSLNGYSLEASTEAWPNSDTGNISTMTNSGTATTLSFDFGALLPDTTYFVHVGSLWNGATTYM